MKVEEDYIREVIREEIKKITENIPLPVENRTSTLEPAEKGVIIGVGKILHAASEHLRQHIDDKGDDPVHEGIRALNDAVSTAIEVQSVAESGKPLDKETEEDKNRTNVKDTDLMIIATAIHDPSSNTKDEALEILNGYLKMNLHENIMNEWTGADECPEADKALEDLKSAQESDNKQAYGAAHDKFLKAATECEKKRPQHPAPGPDPRRIDPKAREDRMQRARDSGGIPPRHSAPLRHPGTLTTPRPRTTSAVKTRITTEDQKEKEK